MTNPGPLLVTKPKENTVGVDISVVVPVYNTARFLRQCVDSLVNQTWKNVEFIFVDDGSTDDSGEILKQYQEKDERIKILQQENMCAGVARNNGMKQATGKYIIFLDSDDYFDLTLLEKAFRRAEKDRAEMVVFGHCRFDNQTKAIQEYLFNMRHGVFSAETLGENVFSAFPIAPWNRFFLRSFLDRHHLEFQAIYKHNDVYWALLSVALAERIVCIDEPLVYYRTNNPKSLQGQKLAAYPYLIECFSALKQSLTALGKFHGRIRNAYNKFLSRSIERRSRSKPEIMLSKQYYMAMKQNLVPRLFESSGDFAKGTIIPRAIYESTDYDNYLLLLFQSMEEESWKTILRKSRAYPIYRRLRWALAIPRRILRAVWPK